MDENFTELKGEIAGPPDTPYEGKDTIFVSFLYCCNDVCKYITVVDKIVTYKLFSPHRRQISARNQDS